MTWFFVVTYIIGYVYSTRRVTRAALWDFAGTRTPTLDDLGPALFIGLAGGFVWPIWLPVLVVYNAMQKHGISGTRIVVAILGETPEQKNDRRERELLHRRMRIRKLERELGFDRELGIEAGARVTTAAGIARLQLSEACLQAFAEEAR